MRSKNPIHRGTSSQNGRGQVLGGQPGTPIKPPFEEINECSVGRSYLPAAPKEISYRNRGLRVLEGIGSGLFFNFYLKEIGSIRLAAFIINSMAFFSFFSTTIP